MAPSSSSAARRQLAEYVAGRLGADRLVPSVAAVFYHSTDRRAREALAPLMDVIERAAPGVVRLARAEGGTGFDVGLAERPFPPAYEVELRRAAQAVLAGAWAGSGAAGRGTGVIEGVGFWGRVLGRVRRLFSASD